MSTAAISPLENRFFETADSVPLERSDRCLEEPVEVSSPINLKLAPAERLTIPTPRWLCPSDPPLPVTVGSPKVSVLVPTYNYARYLAETIESVLKQDFQNFELIIVDDCSSDNSEEIIKHYAALDSRIRYRINPQNLGMVANWNYCLQLARGEYIKFLFGDDTLSDPQALTKLARMLDENPSAVLSVSARHIIDESSQVTETMAHMGSSGLQFGLDVICRCLETNANLIGEPSVVMLRKRDLARGFNPQFRQLTDLEMWFHLLEQGNAVYTSEPLCSFRKHPMQQTEKNKLQQIGEQEHFILLMDFYTRPWVRTGKRRKLLFTQIYWMKKRTKEGFQSPALELQMMHTLGKGWYICYWLAHKTTRPVQNAKRFYLKHILRVPVK